MRASLIKGGGAMRFWDREKEKAWLKHHLQTEPNAILFVYGPKSSGKTTLLMKVVEELFKEPFVYYWFDLRGKLVSSYRDVIDMLFIDEESFKDLEEITERVEGGIMSFFKVSVEKKKKIESRKIDAFEYMEKVLEKHRLEGKKPVIVFDELQKLKEIYLNGDSRQRPLVKELFNFFVRITKVLHLAHVIVMTSDTFFIEQVYTDSTLKNTSRYYPVDFFDDETAKEILISEGMKPDEATRAVEWIGGVPWMMEEVLKGDSREVIRELLDEVSSKLFEAVRGRDDLKELLKKALSGENLYYLEREYEKVKELVEKEVLFMDPIKKVVRFQTRLDEIAARELLNSK